MRLLLALLLALGWTMTDHVYEQAEDAQVLTASAETLVDPWGDPRYQDVDDPTSQAVIGQYAAGVGSAQQTILTSGVVNGDFAQGPPDPDAPIGDENPLPGWMWSGAASISARWIADATSPGGGALRWTVPEGTPAGSTAYIEQIIPVGREEMRAPRLAVVPDAGASSTTSWYRQLQPLTAAGSTTGTAYVPTTLWGWDDDDSDLAGVQRLLQSIPDDARYLRVRIGVQQTVSAAGSDLQADLREVWVGRLDPVEVTIVCAVGTINATGTTTIYPATGFSVSISMGGGWPGGMIGWVRLIGARLSTPRTSGTLSITAWDDTLGTAIGPSFTIDGTHDTEYFAVGPGSTYIEFGQGLRARANVTSGTFAPTTADIVVTYVAAFTRAT